MRSLIHVRSAAFLDLHALTEFDPEENRFTCDPHLLGYVFDLSSSHDCVIGLYLPEALDWGIDAAEALEKALSIPVVYLPRGEHARALDALYDLRRRHSLDLDRSVLYTHAEEGEALLLEYVKPEVKSCRHLPRRLVYR